MMNLRIVLVGLAAFVVGSALSDETCASWDDKIEDLLFDPLKAEIQDTYVLPTLDKSFSSIKVYVEKAVLGKLTSFNLVHLPGVPSASYLCQSASGDNLTLALNIGLSDLNLNSPKLSIKLPILPKIGNTKTTISNQGNAVAISVSLLSDAMSNCYATLNYAQILSVGETTIKFKSGILNSIIGKMLSFFSKFGTTFLHWSGSLDKLNKQFEAQAAAATAKYGKVICDAMGR